jgi:hypothetical protein
MQWLLNYIQEMWEVHEFPKSDLVSELTISLAVTILKDICARGEFGSSPIQGFDGGSVTRTDSGNSILLKLCSVVGIAQESIDVEDKELLLTSICDGYPHLKG